ncbi:nitroreductase family protein [candidate division KSB1 bacterium]|nr:nitroreductase family protein [candidate division KSB1 bacterium]
MSAPYRHVPYQPLRFAPEEMQRRAHEFYEFMNLRRSVRVFSDRPVPRELIEYAVMTANTAPSGAHRQPWFFVAVNDAGLKKQIRIAAEKEERESYEGGRMPAEWRAALAPLGTDWHKPFLEIAPWLVVCFKQSYGVNANGEKFTNYYVNESVGIACGMFIAAIHNMGLVTLTHTPSPMGFLSALLQRPENEKPYILFPVGYPAEQVEVPDIERKKLEEIVQWNLAEGI